MKYTSIIEKILCLGNLVRTSWINLLVLAIAFLFLLLLFSKKVSKKVCFIFIFIATAGLLGYTIYSHYEPLLTISESISDNFFTNIYFPSTYVYLFVLIIIDIVTIGSLLKLKGNNGYKTVNGICFLITNFIFSLILELVADNKIDIFSKTSLFSNTDLVTLLELSINVFIIWLLCLMVISITNLISERIILRKSKPSQPTAITPLTVTVDNKKYKEEYPASENKPIFVPTIETATPESFTQNQFIPDFAMTNRNNNQSVTAPIQNQYQFIPPQTINLDKNTSSFDNNTFDLSSFIPKKQDIKPLNTLNSNQNVFEQILKNELPLVSDKREQLISTQEETEKNSYTLNDYRIFNKMLKDIREHNQSNTISIDKNLEYRLITKYSNETYNMFKKMLKNYSN